MTTEQINQIKTLEEEGYSIRDIADELDISSAEIEDVLTGLTDDSENDQRELGLNDDDLDNITEILFKVQHEKRRLQEDRQQLEADRTELAHKMGKLPEHEELYESFKKRSHKEKMTARFNYLLSELLDNSDKATWSGLEVDDYLERTSSLKEKVRKFCDANRIDERRLLIFRGLTHVIDLVEKMQQQQTSGLFSSKNVRFHFKPETKATIEAFVTANFEDETPQLPIQTAEPAENDDDTWDED